MTMEWTRDQEEAIDTFGRWWKTRASDNLIFRLFGWAGTGKTTIARHLAEGTAGNGTIFAAYTGKAAHVLRKKGCLTARTIHSLIYKPLEKSRERLRMMQEELDSLLSELRAELQAEGSDPKNADLHHLVIKARQEIEAEQLGLKRPSFSINLDSDLRRAKLLVLDECSMVDEEIAKDLLSFEVPILALGDPGQLPPVRGTGFFVNAEPDHFLREVTRTAKDNPIIRMSMDVREGRELELGDHDGSQVIEISEGYPELYTEHEQILVGRENRPKSGTDTVWRANINRRVRTLLGRKSIYPEVGDRLVCLRNDRETGLLNGQILRTISAEEVDGMVAMEVEKEDGSREAITAHSCIFRGEEPKFWEIRDHQCLDFGYAMTVHKAQGSEWPKVLLFDQSRIFRQDWKRWLYTGITRASESVTVVRC